MSVCVCVCPWYGVHVCLSARMRSCLYDASVCVCVCVRERARACVWYRVCIGSLVGIIFTSRLAHYLPSCAAVAAYM